MGTKNERRPINNSDNEEIYSLAPVQESIPSAKTSGYRRNDKGAWSNQVEAAEANTAKAAVPSMNPVFVTVKSDVFHCVSTGHENIANVL